MFAFQFRNTSCNYDRSTRNLQLGGGYETTFDVSKKLQEVIQGIHSSDMYQRSVTQNLWMHAKTWGDVIQLYVEFLKGNIPWSPLHLGELTLDVKEQSIQDLIEVNQLGFVTVDSQPGICERWTNPQTQLSGEEEQRQYIDGYLEEKYYQELVNHLNIPEITIIVANANQDCLYKNDSWKSWSNTHGDYDIEDFLGQKYSDDIPLTLAKIDNTEKWILGTRSKGNECMWRDSPLGIFEKLPQLADLDLWIKENIVHIQLIAQPFCQPNFITSKLLEAMRKITKNNQTTQTQL